MTHGTGLQAPSGCRITTPAPLHLVIIKEKPVPVSMGRKIEGMVGNIQQLDISHQEIDRILKALEEMYTETKANTPGMEWMPVGGVGNLLSHELGCATFLGLEVMSIGIKTWVIASCISWGGHPTKKECDILSRDTPSRRLLRSEVIISTSEHARHDLCIAGDLLVEWKQCAETCGIFCWCRYEDMSEFEDAMGSSFHNFIKRFPIIELKEDDRFTGGYVFRVCTALHTY
jgi:hypothetical protein